MIAWMEGVPVASRSERFQRLVKVATIVGWILVVAVIGGSYIGHASSPYGVCYAASGRSVPCTVVPHRSQTRGG